MRGLLLLGCSLVALSTYAHAQSALDAGSPASLLRNKTIYPGPIHMGTNIIDGSNPNFSGGVVSSDVSQSTVTASGSGAIARTTQARATDEYVNLLDYYTNVAGTHQADGKSCTPVVTIASGSSTLTTDGSCSFSTADVGKTISIIGAGPVATYGSISSVGIVTAGGPYTDGLPYAYIVGATDAYQLGGIDAVLTVNGTVSAVGSIATNGSVCTNGTFTLTAGPNPVGATAATFTGVFAGGTLSTLSVLTPGSYSSLVANNGYAAQLTGNTCATNPTAHLTYVPTSVTVDQAGMGYNIATPGTVMLTYGWAFPITGTTVASNWTITAANARPAPLITTISSVVNSGTVVLASTAGAAVTATNEPVEYGTPIDTAFTNASKEAVALGARCIYIPAAPSGNTYIIDRTLNLASGCLEGDHLMPKGMQTPAAQTLICSNATCLEPLSPVYAGIILGTGASIHYIHRLTSQYIPTSGAFTPTIRPYFIDDRSGGGTGSHAIDHVADLNGTHGIVLDCSNTSGCGNENSFNDIFCGSYMTCFSAHYADNTTNIRGIHAVPLFFPVNSSSVVAWSEQNARMFNIGRMDAGIISDVEATFIADVFVTFPETIGASFANGFGGAFTNATIFAQRFYRTLDPQNSNDLGITYSNLSIQGLSYTGITTPVMNFNAPRTHVSFANLNSQFPGSTQYAELGSGLPGSSFAFSGGQFGTPPPSSGSWAPATSLFQSQANTDVSISGALIYRNSSNSTQPLMSGTGTLTFNGSIAPNAQWQNVVTPTSLATCGTATVSGTYGAMVLTVTGGAPTACTINLSGTLTAVPSLTITPHQAASAWNASTATNAVIIGSSGLANGVYEIYGK